MTTQPTDAKYAALLTMRNEGGKNLYTRLKLADELLSDRAWVEDPARGGGDESTCLDRLEGQCFGDVTGVISLPELLELLREVPEEKVWKQNKYQVRRMHAEIKARREARRPVSTPTTTKKKTEEPAEIVERQRQEIGRLKKTVRQQAREISTLRKQNQKLHKLVRRIRKDLGDLQSTEAPVG